MTPGLVVDLVADLLKGFDNLLAGNSGKASHPPTSTTSSSMEGGMGSSCLRRLVM